MDLPPPPPAYHDIRYSSHYERSVLDIWLPESDEPTPVFVYFHGGGFVGGDKAGAMGDGLVQLLGKGVAVVSVQYPLIGQAHLETGEIIPSLDERGYVPIVQEARLAIDFLIAHAAEYKLDPGRIILCGSSAGALIVESLSYATDLPIAACVARSQPYRFEEYKDLFHSRAVPLYLLSQSGYEDEVHSPRYAKRMAEHCRELGIPVMVFGGAGNDLPLLPAGMDIYEYVYEQLTDTPVSP